MTRSKKSKELRMELARGRSPKKTVFKFFADEAFDAFFENEGNEIVYAGKRKGSLKFSGKDPEVTLGRVFNISLPERSHPAKNVSQFKARFLEAAYGKGNEKSEITQLNSSSLVALMCFYPLKDLNPLVLSFCTNGTEHTCRFVDLVIEKQNPVYAAGFPSCIDLALYGTDVHTGESVVLFLESKFSEYFSVGSVKEKNFGKSYSDDVKRLDAIKRAANLLPGVELGVSEKGCFINGGSHYCGGIKQMISHYIGATNSFELNVEKRKVYLGTILFDFSELVPEAAAALNDYMDCYKGLATLLNTVSSEDRTGVDVLDQAFTYQSLFGAPGIEFKLDEDVAAFYRLGH